MSVNSFVTILFIIFSSFFPILCLLLLLLLLQVCYTFFNCLIVLWFLYSPLFCFIVIQFGRFLSIYLLSFLLLLRLSFIDESIRAIFKFLIDFLCFYFLFILIVCSFSFHISVDIVSLVFHVVDFCLLKPLKY